MSGTAGNTPHNKKRLGRGLASLLGPDEGGFEAGAIEQSELMQLSTDQIDANPFQPRRDFDDAEIAALASSLKEHGMIQPVLVRAVEGRYQLIAGERRLRAAQAAHLRQIPARVMELDDQRVSELAMVENLQREDLNAMDKAAAFKGYMDRYGGTQEELARRLGLDRSTIANLIRLLDLPAEVQDAVRSRKLTAGHARALLGLESAEAQVTACEQVIREALSVRATEALVASGTPGAPKSRLRADSPHKPAAERAPHVQELESYLRDRFQTEVAIKTRSRQRGQIVIEYKNQDEFDRITGLFLS